MCIRRTLLSKPSDMMRPGRPWSDRQWGICIFDDLIEYAGPACAEYQHYFLEPMLNALSDKSPEVRQAAAYGFGVLGQVGGPMFAKTCADCIPSLVQLINAPDSRSPENIGATENAIAAVTKILAHNNSCLSVDELIPVWLSWLPVWDDLDEAPHVYSFLCTLLEQNSPTLLGEDNCNLPRIVMVIAEAFAKEALVVNTEVGKRVIGLMSVIRSNEEVFSACVSQLNQQQKEALCAALSATQ